MNEKLKIYGENGENQSQMNSCQFAKRATSEFFSGLSLMLVGSGLKRSMLIEKLGSSSLVSSIFQREGKLHCSFTGRELLSQVKKKCSRHLIYTRACVNKDLIVDYVSCKPHNLS